MDPTPIKEFETKGTLPALLSEIFQHSSRVGNSKLVRNWKKQDLSAEKKHSIELYKSLVKFFPKLILRCEEVFGEKYQKELHELRALSQLTLEGKPLHLIDTEGRCNALKDQLIVTLSQLPDSLLEQLKEPFLEWPTGCKNILELAEIQKKFTYEFDQKILSDVNLFELSKKALSLEDPQRALLIAEPMTTDLLKMMIYKNVLRFYIENNQINKGLNVIIHVDDPEAKKQLIKALSYLILAKNP